MGFRRESVESAGDSGLSDRRPTQAYLHSMSRRDSVDRESPEDLVLSALAAGNS
jgi:hypothetical protein